MLSDKGRVQVRRLRVLQQDGAARLRHTISALLKWLFAVAPDQKPVDPSDFLAARRRSLRAPLCPAKTLAVPWRTWRSAN
ncbi:hypothetical protein [Streptomyces syringium]|uniref:Uncharacterized protein n=1 Tax=Streptomyces syringium TaxID=76729 RepID=A0ABS4YE65_9ACTN|nr:hypothetical protein [Streptomyces syringium]MBP2407046.1 hypothetical protein [Streptomyces syringium]